MVNKGAVIQGFEILDLVDLEEMKARGIWARHKSGAELFHVLNDDPENLFAFAFATAPEDSTGAAHILEHSVLCGSQHYPLKDAFLTLAQGSLQTFLNAWTFPDKTVYPASSVNEKDYFNLMSVYADAVFRPLLSEWTFMQEGWRLVPGKKGFEYTGVVYNEMKGAYSSMDAYAELWSVRGVMTGAPYAFDSGGDPDCIPDLSWEGLKEFHRSRYAPANCRIFLAGNIPTEKQMEFLDKNCLAGLEGGTAAPMVRKTPRWDAPRTLQVSCPGHDGKEGQKPEAILSWLCSDNIDTAETGALACLAEILLGHDGSPLIKVLLESGLGEDLSPVTGIENELRETVFCTGLRGLQVEDGKADEAFLRFETLVLNELNRLVKEGLPKKEIEAAMLSIEFSHREIKRSHGPYSLVWMRRALRGWLHGARPWESMLFMPDFTALKRRLSGDSRFFESLIEKYLIHNPHRAGIVIKGEADYLPKKEENLFRRLREKEKALSDEEKKLLAEKAAKLEQIQTAPDDALKSIPHLSREDLKAEIERVPAELRQLDTGSTGGSSGAVPCMVHPLFTNGISYADLAFPVDVLDPADYPWLPFFARAVVSVGLPGMDYGEVSSLIARTAGGFYALLETGSPAPPPVPPPAFPELNSGLEQEPAVPAALTARDWLIYRIKALDEKFVPALDLARRLIVEADFSDLRRLRDLAMEMKNDGDSSIAPSGHNYASGCSGKYISRSRAVDELWNGINQIPFSHRLAAMDMEELRDRMIYIRNALLKAGLFLNLTCSAGAAPGAMGALESFGSFGPPGPPNPQCRRKESFFSLFSPDPSSPPRQGRPVTAEVYASPSLQIGFAAMSLPSAPYGSLEQAAELVFSHELSTGPLWESIRMKGGAYGAFSHPDNLEGVFSLSTYRDPDPLRSLGAFSQILKDRSIRGIDQDRLEKAIIGAYARETAPRTPAEKGFAEFLRRLYGIGNAHRMFRLKSMIALGPGDANAAARRLAEAAEQQPYTGLGAGQPGSFPGLAVVVAGMKTAERAAKKLGVELRVLPV
ncbi:MAG: insulinase family protein [Spirochaetaceae bacterium]|jgi:Zn-dependent M16 (insulinase) family peptidase|nr:insulinase family protein [Spirochaetaceae bacterium]